MQGVSPNSPLCQKTLLSSDINKNKSFVLQDVQIMFSVGSLLPTSFNLEACIAFSFKDVLSV